MLHGINTLNNVMVYELAVLDTNAAASDPDAELQQHKRPYGWQAHDQLAEGAPPR